MKKDREYKRQLDNKKAWNLINKYKISLEKNEERLSILKQELAQLEKTI